MFILQAFKDSVWDRIVKIPVNPERKYLYSDLSFLILQKVAEKSAKMDLDKFVSQEFYKELGATTMGYNPTKRFPISQIIPTERDSFLRKQLLLGYVHDQNAAFLGGVAGHAGLFANANDMAKLYQMILNGGTYGNYTYLSKETCDLFTTEKSAISRRGLGFDRHVSEDFSDSTKLGHVMYGHTGFTGTCVWIDPQEEIIYIFLSNRIHPESWNKKLLQLNVRGKIEDVIYEAIEK
jgi:CubicO group peptidase (beta-lactamase class C family)